MRVIHSLLLLSSFGLRAAAAAGADAFLSSAGENKIGQLNEAVRSMAQSETAKASLWGDFSWSLTEGKDQPLHSWYVLADPTKTGVALLRTIGLPQPLDSDPDSYQELLAESRRVADDHGVDPIVKPNKHYFDAIRAQGPGSRLSGVLRRMRNVDAALAMLRWPMQIGDGALADDVRLWKLLMQTIKLGDKDFEHQFGIVGDGQATAADAAAAALKEYTFPEIMLLTRSILFVPVLQHAEPMSPGMWAENQKDVVGGPRPLLSVGLVAGCVKGPVWNHLAENHPELALQLADTNHVGRQLAQILQAILFSGLDNWALFSTLPGSGAFAANPGARAKDIAPKFFAGLEHGLLAGKAHAHANRVSLYGAPGWFGTSDQISKLNKDIGSEMVDTKPKAGIASQIAADEWGVVIAGFDPVALAPHGAQLRAVSGEGQLGAGTTLFETLGAYPPGSLVKALVAMPKNNPPQPKEGPKFEIAQAVRMLPKEYIDFCAGSQGELSLTPSEGGNQRPDNNDSMDGWDLACKKGEELLKLWTTPFEPRRSPDKRPHAEAFEENEDDAMEDLPSAPVVDQGPPNKMRRTAEQNELLPAEPADSAGSADSAGRSAAQEGDDSGESGDGSGDSGGRCVLQ